MLLQFNVTAYQMKCGVVSCSVSQRGQELMLAVKVFSHSGTSLKCTVAKGVQKKRRTHDIWGKGKEEVAKASVWHGGVEEKEAKRKHS